jgi:hypothetical protein
LDELFLIYTQIIHITWWVCIYVYTFYFKKLRDERLSFPNYFTLFLSACWKISTNILQGVSSWEVDHASFKHMIYLVIKTCLQVQHYSYLINWILQIPISLTLSGCIILCCCCFDKLYMASGMYISALYNPSSYDYLTSHNTH